jgi:hypothetical protein
MTYTTLSLVDGASGLSCVLRPRDGVAVQTLDVQPNIRAVSNSVAGGDGAFDITQFAGPASVTVSLRLWNGAQSPEAFLDELAPLLAPWRRPALVVSNDQWTGPRQLAVRFDSRTAPVDNPVSTDLAVTWDVPSGCWTATALTEYDLPALADPTTGLHITDTGLHFVAGAGITFPAVTTPSPSLVAVPGSARPAWKARLYGPCTGPKLTSDTLGLDIVFTDSLVLTAGQYVELDSAAHTANLLSDPAQSVLDKLDFAKTTWWDLEPGITNQVRYHPSSGAASGAVLSFSAAWLP